MDLRQKKTLRSIKNSFLQLRARKPLERITIRELSEMAEISKATFYLHYQDIYDLSSKLQDEVIKSILDSVIQPGNSLLDTDMVSHALFDSFQANEPLISVLFSDSQAAVLPQRIEQGVKEYVFNKSPELREDARLNIMLSYQIYGSYYGYWMNQKQFGHKEILDVLDSLAGHLQTWRT